MIGNSKHPNYNDSLLPVNNDIFKPEFRRDSSGNYFMQLPGYGKWKVSVTPGSKIIAQGSESETGGPATDPGSIRTGSLSVESTIWVGDSIYLDGGTGCIIIGDTKKVYLSMCKDGIKGVSENIPVFAFLLEKQEWEWRASEKADKGDVLIGDISNNEYVYWNDDESKLYIKGDLIIEGDLQSENFVTGVSGWRLGYYDDTAEFQDVWVRGKITMEAGSSGDADYIDESAGRKWAAESGADITGGHTSNDTNYVYGDPAVDVASGAERGLNALNASYRYKTWLTSSDMASSGISSGPAVVMDNNGIYGWNGSGDNTFQLNSSTGDCLLRGTVYASAGLIGGWALDADRIWNQLYSSPNYTKLELNVREGTGINMHIQAFTDDNSSYTSPTGVQITPGVSSAPDPRLDIYDNGTRRVTLNTTGLRFYASNGTTVNSQILLGTGDGDITFGGGVVRCFSGGVRTSWGQPFSAADNTGSSYFQMYVDTSSGSFGYENVLNLSTSNSLKISTNSGNAIARFYGVGVGSYGQTGGPYVLDLFGPLRLFSYPPAGGPYGSHPGNSTGAIYYSNGGYVAEGVWVRLSTGWTQLGGSGLPSGSNYEMMRSLGGTSWEATDKLWVGGSSTNQIFMSGADMTYEISSSGDYAFKRGSTYSVVIDNNFWTMGNLLADGGCQTGGTISNSAGDIICYAGNLQLLKTGAIVAIKTSTGSTKYLTCQFDATVGSYILKD